MFLHIRDNQNYANIRRNRIFRDRLNPLDAYNDAEIIARYRLSRELIIALYDLIGPNIEPQTERSHAIPGMMQLFCCLRYYACGSFQRVVGDGIGIERSTVSRIVSRVTIQLCNVKNMFIQFPHTQNDIVRSKQEFYEIAQFPNIIGAIDGTLINIVRPRRDEHLFVNRKGKHSLNVLAVCDAHAKFTYVVAKYPGSVNDAFIWRHCRLQDMFTDGEIPSGWLLGDNV